MVCSEHAGLTAAIKCLLAMLSVWWMLFLLLA